MVRHGELCGRFPPSSSAVHASFACELPMSPQSLHLKCSGAGPVAISALLRRRVRCPYEELCTRLVVVFFSAAATAWKAVVDGRRVCAGEEPIAQQKQQQISREGMRGIISAVVAGLAGCDVGEDQPLAAAGLDSLAFVELRNELSRHATSALAVTYLTLLENDS